MYSLRTLLRPAFAAVDLRASLARVAIACLGLALAACGSSADAPPPPETVPVVLTQPDDASVVVGTAATFTVVATGAAPLAYQWASSADGTTFAAIPGATGSSYDTGVTTLGQSGTSYRVVVSNSLGSATSSVALLTVTPAPVAPAITVQPADQTVTAPATATFSVTAIGTAPAYEWQSSSDGGATFAPVAGAPSAPTLALTNTTPSQNGQRYRVRVSNAAGNVTSNAALLTVNAAPSAPVIATQPASQSVVAGAAVSFLVAATGNPTPTLQWRLGGINLADGALSTGACAGAVVAAATSSTLALTAVPIGCSGSVFSVVASNGVSPDATSNGATLTVTAAAAAPSITAQPADRSVVVGTAAVFTAAASGAPTPTVQWQQSTDAGVTWANITAATSTSYTTPATVLADSGKRFRAVFSNASGSATSDAAVLTVTTMSSPAFTSPYDIAIDAAGDFYVANPGDQTIRKISSTGVVSLFAGSPGNIGATDGTGSAALFRVPRGVGVDAAGNVYVADTTNATVRKITPAGVVSTLAGLAGTGGSADGTGSAARFGAPWDIAVDSADNAYVTDSANATIRKITPAGVVTTLAGLANATGFDDGVGSAARFGNVSGIAVDAADNIYVTDRANTIRKITTAGVVTTLAGMGGVPAGSTDGTGSAARFADPQGVAVDSAGNVYVADTANFTIRKITPAGVVTTLAGQAGSSGNVDATGSAARFARPRGMTVDAAGNVYVADTDNGSIRRITPAGVVTTFAQ